MAWKRRSRGWQPALLLACALAALPGCRKDSGPAGPGGDPDKYPIVSTFDKDLEGWNALNDGRLNWEPTGGTPSGYARGVDLLDAKAWYFRAPNRFLGNVSGAYGKILSFDLYWFETVKGNPNGLVDDVILIGARVTLAHTYPQQPGQTWTSYKLRLDESGGWVNTQTRQPATRAEIQEVLSDLREFRIRGEFTDNAEQAGLDNVRLGAAS